MSIGLVLLGMVFGLCGALAALLAGGSVWMALTAYSGFGCAGVLLATCAAMAGQRHSAG